MKKWIALCVLGCFQLAYSSVAPWQYVPPEGGPYYEVVDKYNVLPHKAVILCVCSQVPHYVVFRASLDPKDHSRVLGYKKLTYSEAKKFFPFLKYHKKVYLQDES